jgi:hypothetical protein
LPFACFFTMKLPKGLTDDCARPACDDTASNLKAAIGRIQSKQPKQDATNQCPPDSAQLGRSTWDLLHSMVSTSGTFCAVGATAQCVGQWPISPKYSYTTSYTRRLRGIRTSPVTMINVS